jgi:hypothetical protein
MARQYAASRMPMTSVNRYLFLFRKTLQPIDGMMLPNSMTLAPAKRTLAHPATGSRIKTDIAGGAVNSALAAVNL